jgi:hypothetical protein
MATEYVVLQRAESGLWRELPGVTDASDGDAACRHAARAEDGKTRAGAFKAVPVRSWRGGLVLRPEVREVVHVEPLDDDRPRTEPEVLAAQREPTGADG